MSKRDQTAERYRGSVEVKRHYGTRRAACKDKREDMRHSSTMGVAIVPTSPIPILYIRLRPISLGQWAILRVEN